MYFDVIVSTFINTWVIDILFLSKKYKEKEKGVKREDGRGREREGEGGR